MNDREHRNNKTLDRKQVFLVTENETSSVEMHFGKKYTNLFEKTIDAFTQIPSKYVGKILAIDRKNPVLVVTYLGRTLEPSAESVPKILSTLRDIHNENTVQEIFKVPRYIQSFYEIFEDEYVQSLIKYIEESAFKCSAGFGIDDPVASNFTEDSTGVHLVDLDHFSSKVSLSYQMGFIIADIDVLTNQKYRSVNAMQKTARPFLDDFNKSEEVALVCGYISRLCIDVINAQHNFNSHRSNESLKHIHKLINLLIA